MTIDAYSSAAVLVVVALVTALTRALPYLFFGRKKEIPKIAEYLGAVLPASIMIILVVYCLKDVDLTSYPFGMAELISVAIVMVTQLKKGNTFLSIFAGTVSYMILIRTVFPV